MTASRPTAPTARNVLLDVLHGAAMLGVVVVDFPMIFRPVWTQFLPGRAAAEHGLDGAARAAITFFLQTKSLSLFALLFGVSFAILQGKFSEDEDFFLHYCRRMTVLFLLGVFQGVFFWYNSILVLLAGTGFAALLLRRLDARRSAVDGGLLFLLGALGALAAFMVSGVGALPMRYVYHTGYLAGWEDVVFKTGTFRQVAAFRAASFLFLGPPFFVLFAVRVLAFILLGRALYQAGWFADGPQARRRWRRCLLLGTLLGTPLSLVSVWAERVPDPSPALLVVQWLSLYFGSAALAAAYLGGICLAVWSRPGLAETLAPLAAAGRMCLTNFLAVMAVGSWLACPYGLGLYDRFGTAAAAAAGMALYGALVWASAAWLRRFRFGPCEALLRAAAYRMPLKPGRASSTI